MAATRSPLRAAAASAALVAIGLGAACSADDDTAAGSGGSADPTIDASEAATTPADTAEAFDPEVVDDGLVPVEVDEIVLGDDVIIATDDGQIPTTTIDATPPEPAPTTAPPPVTTAAPPAPATVGRVVSLSPTHTETIAALGGAGLLVGIDVDSIAPPDASNLATDSLAPDDLDIGAIRALDPDLVVVDQEFFVVAGAELAEASIPFFDGTRPSSLDGVLEQVRALGAAVGLDDAGSELAARMGDDIDAIRASLPPAGGLTYYHEVDPLLSTIPPGTFLDTMYAELGLTSIAPPTDLALPIIPESDLFAADPDVIILGDVDCCAVTAASLATRAGWGQLGAVRDGAIVELTDRHLYGFGIGVVELLDLVADGIVAAT